MRKKKKDPKQQLLAFIVALVLLAVCWYLFPEQMAPEAPAATDAPAVETLPPAEEGLPEYSGDAYTVLGNNIPGFTEEEKKQTESFEDYSPLDDLGRCTVTYACIGTDLKPTEERGDIHMIYPSGWEQEFYNFVDGEAIYNRCHLIGFQLTGENANERNLLTGTRYMNTQGMLPFENMVADYLRENPDNHVLYRVTPVFEGDELVARGVIMEGWSVEDGGEGICYKVFCHNVQPGVIIDYATGENWLDENAFTDGDAQDYILNVSSMKFHYPDCSGAQSMSQKNRQDFTGTREMLTAQGFEPCPSCKP